MIFLIKSLHELAVLILFRFFNFNSFKFFAKVNNHIENSHVYTIIDSVQTTVQKILTVKRFHSG